MSNAQTLIEYSQSYLKKQPFDIVHDLEHHQLVVNNCLEIIRQEHLVPDQDVLVTAAWWHDVEKSYETANSADNTVDFLRKTGQELGVDANFVEKCCQTILQHSFRQTQTSLEGKILFDADKIEYVNSDRIGKLIEDFEANPEKYKTESLQETHDIWVDRIQKVAEMMHFPYSKQLFLKKLKQTEDVLERFQRALDNRVGH